MSHTSLLRHRVVFPVVVADYPKPAHIVGWLTIPKEAKDDLLQIVIHGAKYDHSYWDFPLDPERYSYVDWSLRHHRSVLLIDRLGSGESEHPPSSAVGLDANAAVIHQIVRAIREHGLEGHRFRSIILVGHSYGSRTALWEASIYGDVDGLILTGSSGLVPAVNPAVDLVGRFHKASDDPVLASRGYDGGYLTTVPGRREDMFYWAAELDPRVPAFDERTKSSVTQRELDEVRRASGDAGRHLDIPVLCLAGEQDPLEMSGNPRSAAATKRTADEISPANFEFTILPDMGHNLALQTNAHAAFQAMEQWLQRLDGIASGPIPK
jgi:pimeloyl-ACP methyl ester carboxylesterase